MTVYVIRETMLGELLLVEKKYGKAPRSENRKTIPAPMLSRFEPMRSPVDERWITSWRQRDRDMDAVGKVDPRDLPAAPFERRNIENARRRELDRSENTD